jgi:hypothetical protein
MGKIVEPKTNWFHHLERMQGNSLIKVFTDINRNVGEEEADQTQGRNGHDSNLAIATV